MFIFSDCETVIFYVRVIQKNQNIAGTLSLRSARSGTKSATSRSLSTDGPPSTCYVQLSGDSLNSSLTSWLPDVTLDNRYRVGNCAEVDAVNQALNSGANVADLYMYTINIKDNIPKPMCNNCVYTFVGRVADIFSE